MAVRRWMAVVAMCALAGCGGGDGEGMHGACRRLQEETLADPAGLLAAVEEIEDSGSMFLVSEASKALGAVRAAADGHAPADVWERVESLRMACAIDARG